MRFSRTQGPRGAQVICSLGENDVWNCRQGNLGCGWGGAGPPLCSEGGGRSFVWKSPQMAPKPFRGGGEFVLGKKKEMRNEEIPRVGGGQEMLPWRARALLFS